MAAMELVIRLRFKMLFMLVMFLAFRCGEGQVVIANTTLGQVMGLKIKVGPGDPVLTRFAGIPYAEPPTGQLRLAKPVPKSPWDGVLNATAYGPKCSQAAGPTNSSDEDRGMDEDCLTLNVYSPHTIVDFLGPLPVMVYIHGGALVSGEGAIYDGTSLALQGQVVVVNFNYRLGALGFLSTGDDSAPGNYGLWDQRLAIQWVKDNIGNFGGDPDKITIFGESAGGWSVTYQMVSPVNNKTLFQRVIAQSGVAFPGIVNPRGFANMQAWSLGTSIGCDLPEGSSTKDLISCLRNVSADYLQNKMGNNWNSKATIDGEFIPDDINSLLAHPRIGQYDLLLGVVSGEGSVFLHNNTQSFTAQDLEDNILSNISSTCYCTNPQDITYAIQAWYFGADKLDNPRENVVKYTDVMGDLYFDVASANLRNRHAAASTDTNTYFYYFTYETGREFFLPPEFSGWFPRAPHALDVLYIFGWISTFSPNDPWAGALSTNMIKYWAAFARNGDPNADGLSYWPKFEAENETYINLHPNVTIGRHFKADKIAFWVDYIPKITDSAFGAVSTPPPSTMTTPESKPCKIGQRIGLSLTPEEASTLIEALIGVTIGVLVLAVFFFGGCMAYRSRINRLEAEAGKQGGGTKGISNLNLETF